MTPNQVEDRIAREMAYRHRFVDIVLVKFGQLGDELDLGIGTEICLVQQHLNNGNVRRRAVCLDRSI